MIHADSISGKVFWRGEFLLGTLYRKGNSLSFSEEPEMKVERTVIPAFFNAHTHLGDSFVMEEPVGTLPEVVGPGGFKQRMLESAEEATLLRSMATAFSHMLRTGTFGFADFRESGVRGISLIRKALRRNMQAIILGRPSSGDESLEHVISMCDGLALSAISDVDPALLDASRDACRRMGKLFAIHFNEDRREDLELLLSLEPDFIVHGIQCTKDEMKRLADAGIPVAITPRSNIFYGKRPDYSAFLDSGVTLMLGTDNAMVSEPDMFSEMDFLYRYQRGLHRIGPEKIISMATWNAYTLLGSEPRAFIVFMGDESAYDIVTRGRMRSFETFSIP